MRRNHPRLPYAVHLLVGMMCGVGLARVAPVDWAVVLLCGATVVAAVSASWSLLRRGGALGWLATGVAVGTLRVALLSPAFYAADDLRWELPTEAEDLEVEMRGTVVEGQRRTPAGWRAVVEVSGLRARGNAWLQRRGRVLVWTDTAGTPLLPGDEVTAQGRLMGPRQRMHRFESSSQIRDLVAVLFADTVIRAPASQGLRPSVRLRRWIDSRRLETEEVLLVTSHRRGAAWVLAVGSGTRALMENSDRDVMRRSGLAHLLAVSGLHLALFVVSLRRLAEWLVSWVPPLIRRRERRWYGALFAIPAAWAFVLFTGAGTASIRAACFLTALSAGHLLRKPNSSAGAVGLAGNAILLVWPNELVSPGFQLSLAAVTGLLLAQPSAGRVELAPRGIRWLRRAFACALAATLATAPITAYHFGQVAVSGLLTNVILAPVMALTIVPIAGLALALAPVHPDLAHWMVGAIDALVGPCLWLADGIAGWVGDPQVVGRPTALELAACAGVLFAIVAASSYRVLWRPALKMGIPCLVLLTTLAMARLAAPAHLELWFLPVGHGDAALVRFPSGHNLLIDTGGSYGSRDPGREVVVPILRGLGVRHLDAVVITHHDLDHVGGLGAVLESYRPAELWVNSTTRDWLEGGRRIPPRAVMPTLRVFPCGTRQKWALQSATRTWNGPTPMDTPKNMPQQAGPAMNVPTCNGWKTMGGLSRCFR